MARVFAYLMNASADLSDVAIFEDTSQTILNALQKTKELNSSRKKVSKTSFQIALNQLII